MLIPFVNNLRASGMFCYHGLRGMEGMVFPNEPHSTAILIDE